MLLSLVALSLLTSVTPQEPSWHRPAPEVVNAVTAPPTPGVAFAPDGTRYLWLERRAMPALAELARPAFGLAGVRVDPTRNRKHGALTITGILVDSPDAEPRRVELPEGSLIGRVLWSPDSRHFAFTLVRSGVDAEGTELWLGSAQDATASSVLPNLNDIFDSFAFASDGGSVLALAVPQTRPVVPAEEMVASGPIVQESRGRRSPVRTYQDLLQNARDMVLLEHYVASEPVRISLEDRELTKAAPVGLYLSIEPSPVGGLLLTTRMVRPFSTSLPYWRFPQVIEVFDAEGKLVEEIARLPLAEEVPIGGVRGGPRSVSWHPFEPGLLTYVEALDGGDPKREAEHRDRWMLRPIGAEPSELIRLEQRSSSGLAWLEGGEHFVVREYDRDRRWVRRLLVRTADDSESLVIEDRNVRDAYADPGRPVMGTDVAGRSVVRQDGVWFYHSGEGASPEGLYPFVDRVNVRTGESERLWRAEGEVYERFVAFGPRTEQDEVLPTFFTTRESVESPPNLSLRHFGTSEMHALSNWTDPTPELRNAHKEIVQYERPDGVSLSATLYLPAGYERGMKLPLVVWAYPREYSDVRTAGQVRKSPYRYTRFRGPSHLYFLTQGYAIMDGATMPVIGDPETVNDTFVEQIVSAAQAAVDEAVRRGFGDRNRVGIGGHSYGAFMTANLLAHSDIFSAGIARSGAYNRTLTPFGFQAERRTLWEATDVYVGISPFMAADRIDEPLLLLHGANDPNSGTHPLQSKRLYAAVAGHAGTVRHVVLPHEGHGYRSEEAVLHTLWEMFAWFDEHVARGGPVEAGFGR